jgi:hypothetical protein
MRLVLALPLLFGGTGCRVFAGKADYADYRQVRLASAAHDDTAKLAAMRRYVQAHPDGSWFDEVAAARARYDRASFEAGKTTRPGLERYLALFPDGAHAAQARSRLSAIDLLDQRRREAEARAAILAAEQLARQAELRRTWVSRFLAYWSQAFLGLTGWSRPIAEVAQHNAGFSRAFGAEPRPRCTEAECVKYYAASFGVPVPGGTRIERNVSLLLRLRLEQGALVRAELLLPERGFSRLYELEQRELIVDSDPEGRRRAADWAIARVLALWGEFASNATVEADYALAPIDQPALGPSGELIDTAAQDPSVPPNRLLQADTSMSRRSIEQLVQPSREPAADMVFGPMPVDRAGGAPAAPDMRMAPVAVPDPAQPGGASDTPAVAAAPALVVPPDVRAYRLGALRIVIFAAGSETSAPFDGVLIEPVSEPPRASRGARR